MKNEIEIITMECFRFLSLYLNYFEHFNNQENLFFTEKRMQYKRTKTLEEIQC